MNDGFEAHDDAIFLKPFDVPVSVSPPVLHRCERSALARQSLEVDWNPGMVPKSGRVEWPI
jgi:hypothetical protein